MKIDFGIDVILYLAAISIGLFFSLSLFFSSKNKTANRLLALLIAAIIGWLVDAFLRVAGIYGQHPDLYFLPIFYSFGFGPLLYFYVQAITNKAFRFGRKHLLHFIPVFIQAAFYWIITFKSYQAKYVIWFNIHQPYTYRLEYDGTWLSLVIYLVLAIIYFKKYQSWLNEHYSNVSKITLNWLKSALAFLVMICVTWLFEAYLRDFKNTYYQYDVSTNLLCLVVYCIGIVGMQQAATQTSFQANEIAVPQPPLSPVVDQEIVARIEDAMIINKLYLNPELSLGELAAHLNLPAKTVSANINAAFNKPFNTYVNSFRVAEIKTRFETADLEKFTLLGIAFESGFNSKTSFNRIFKDFTGQSPSTYIKK